MIARWSFLLTRLSLVLGSPAVLAQIVTDGMVGPATRLSGPEMTIGAELGSTRGGNLFHSFQRFDIPTGQRATFTGPDQIRNVIGRVTGGQTSHIDGTLRSTVGQADVYLINPSGVVMGPNAKVDVPAAFHVSTADEVRFSDGSRYSATDPAASRLTLATPESFGFLSPQPASLRIEGSQLELKPGKTATLTAGDVSIAGTAERRATLKAPGGEIRLEAVGYRGGQVSVTTPTEQPGSGRLRIQQARIETSGDGGGRLSVRAGNAHLTDTTLAADNLGDLNAVGGADLAVSETLALSASRVQSNSVAGGASGGVRVRARDLSIQQAEAKAITGLLSEVETSATGAAGGVSVQAEQTIKMRGAVGITSSTFGAGDGGAVNVGAQQLIMDGEGRSVFYRGSQFIAGISSEVFYDVSGQAGDVTLDVIETLSVLNSGVISSSTFGAGNAGSINVKSGNLLLDGSKVWIASTSTSGFSSDAGMVSLTVDGLLEVLNGAAISSSTWAPGKAGGVTIAAGSARLDGLGTPDQFTGIASTTGSGFSSGAGTVSPSHYTHLHKS